MIQYKILADSQHYFEHFFPVSGKMSLFIHLYNIASFVCPSFDHFSIKLIQYQLGPVKRICVFEHSVMTFAARKGDKYQIRLTRPN